MKMGRRLRCSSVTYRFRYAPSYRPSGSDRLAGGPFIQKNASYFGDRTLENKPSPVYSSSTDKQQLTTSPLPRRIEFKVGPGSHLAVLWIESFNADLFKDRLSFDLLS